MTRACSYIHSTITSSSTEFYVIEATFFHSTFFLITVYYAHPTSTLFETRDDAASSHIIGPENVATYLYLRGVPTYVHPPRDVFTISAAFFDFSKNKEKKTKIFLKTKENIFKIPAFFFELLVVAACTSSFVPCFVLQARFATLL